ncbi:MAG: hypothetical protein A3K10_12090 [Bacteroidetes bacterium RIFCSPLOWO2_12_FULL_31_6]|nr:MAG: hypothetical protein A3K10_12090 [Bacteroidetes bacterium RIFCSPLOWO2_12_FULL_31_6]
MLFLFSNKFKAQHAEIGVLFGTSYYVGELNPSNPFINKINPAIGVLYRKNLNKRYALRYGLNYGLLAADDNYNKTEWNKIRNLSFSTSILEVSGLLEFNFLPYQINNYNTSPFTPFVFIGAAVFRVAPEVKNNSINTTSKSKSIIAPSIPFGVGVKFDFIRNIGLNIEWGVRKTFTDEIDGLPNTSANGYQISNSNNKDWYSFAGITLNYKILTKTDRCPVVK